MGINVLVKVGGTRRGFWVSVAKELSRDHHITISGGPGIVEVVQRVAPELAINVDVRSNFKPSIDKDRIIDECRKREDRYGEFFSMISSQDRGLGKGYIFNADKHPDMVNSWWGHEEKLTAILQDFVYHEQLVSRYPVDAIITPYNDKITSLVARQQKIPTMAISQARTGSRFLWAEDEFVSNAHLEAALKKFLEDGQDIDASSPLPDYQQITSSREFHSRIDYSYRFALKESGRRILKESYNAARATAGRFIRRKPARSRRDGYRFAGWVGPVLRRPYIHRYFLKHGLRPENLDGYKFVYFPLHLEPEVALLALSPEFNNSMEAIAWISKSLPADTILLVKEQPVSFGIRSRHFYDNLRRIGNVALAHPSVHPWDWIKAAKFTATITGTTGFEAVNFEKPVLSFGKHQIINNLPTTRYAHNYETTRQSVDELLKMDPDDTIFKKSKRAMYLAQLESSFELPDYSDVYRKAEPAPELAHIAVSRLYEQYPNVFKQA